MRRRKTRREDQAVVVDSFRRRDSTCWRRSPTSAPFPTRAGNWTARYLARRSQTALDKLTPRERMVFELKHYQGLRLRTIGEMLNTTEETAKNTLFRATKKLRASLAVVR